MSGSQSAAMIGGAILKLILFPALARSAVSDEVAALRSPAR
jgi:hypothetical protein